MSFCVVASIFSVSLDQRWLGPLKWRLTARYNGSFNRPNTFILSWVPVR